MPKVKLSPAAKMADEVIKTSMAKSISVAKALEAYETMHDPIPPLTKEDCVALNYTNESFSSVTIRRWFK